MLRPVWGDFGRGIFPSGQFAHFTDKDLTNNIDIGIICTTKENAQEVADRLCFAGIKGIWNFAPVDLEVPSHVALENVQLSESLHSLAYHINRECAAQKEIKEIKEKCNKCSERGEECKKRGEICPYEVQNSSGK